MFRNNYFPIVRIITALISYPQLSWEMVQRAASLLPSPWDTTGLK